MKFISKLLSILLMEQYLSVNPHLRKNVFEIYIQIVCINIYFKRINFKQTIAETNPGNDGYTFQRIRNILKIQIHRYEKDFVKDVPICSCMFLSIFVINTGSKGPGLVDYF